MRASTVMGVMALMVGAPMAGPTGTATAGPSGSSKHQAFGDFNGDGLADVVVGGPVDTTDDSGDPIIHSAVVVLGSRNPENVDLLAPTAGATVHIRTAHNVESQATVGDIDGDGLTDVMVAAYASGPNDGASDSGGQYIVFGRRNGADVSLDHPTAGVRRLPGSVSSLWPVGDVNGDGIDDLAIERQDERSIAVIFGRRDRAPISAARVRAPGRRGFVVGLGRFESVVTAASAGDANGDGIGDLVVVPEHYRYCGEGGNGCGGPAFVILGRRHPVALDVRGSYGSHRFEIVTRGTHAPASYYVSAVFSNVGSPGDFNGDGRDDLLGLGWEYGPGTVIVYGRLSLRPPHSDPPLAPDAVAIRHADTFGEGAGPLGDVNGDGLGDVVVSDADRRRVMSVVLGRARRTTVDTRHLGPNGWHITTPARASLSSPGRIGDVNGDGLDDIALLSPPPEYDTAGTRAPSFVVLGRRTAPKAGTDVLTSGAFTIR